MMAVTGRLTDKPPVLIVKREGRPLLPVPLALCDQGVVTGRLGRDLACWAVARLAVLPNLHTGS
jgi:hypothetical protein